MKRFLSPCLALALLAPAAFAQFGPAPRPLPPVGPSPLLFVRFVSPAGMRVTFYQGQAGARSFAAPVAAGLRPGYVYRVQLSDLPGYPGIDLYPTLEVRGSLLLPPRLTAASFPVNLVLNPEDIEAALAGTLVTKVVYLENPDRAIPTPTRPDELLETPLAPGRDAWREAWDLGRPVLILRLGERRPDPLELVFQSSAGTVLFPGEKSLSQPGRPPCLPWVRWPFYDPAHGPCGPEEECIHDGGDRWPFAGLDVEGRLRGLDPEDTVAEYTDYLGRRRVTCSNTVCLCVPRFAALRCLLPLSHAEGVLGPTATRGIKGNEVVFARQPLDLLGQAKRPAAMEGRTRPSENVNTKAPAHLVNVTLLEAREIALGPVELLGSKEVRTLSAAKRALLLRQLKLVKEFSSTKGPALAEGVVGPQVVGRVEGGPEVVKAVAETRDLTVCCHEVPCPPAKPLVLVKCADRASARPGDVITFSLRYSNHGGRPIADVAVSDSLSGRLEYVPGSAETDRPAVLTVEENEVGSVILRWEVTGRLLPGESGRIRFKARVR